MTLEDLAIHFMADYVRRGDSEGLDRFMLGMAIGLFARAQLERGDVQGARETWAILGKIATW